MKGFIQNVKSGLGMGVVITSAMAVYATATSVAIAGIKVVKKTANAIKRRISNHE